MTKSAPFLSPLEQSTKAFLRDVQSYIREEVARQVAAQLKNPQTGAISGPASVTSGTASKRPSPSFKVQRPSFSVSQTPNRSVNKNTSGQGQPSLRPTGTSPLKAHAQRPARPNHPDGTHDRSPVPPQQHQFYTPRPKPAVNSSPSPLSSLGADAATVAVPVQSPIMVERAADLTVAVPATSPMPSHMPDPHQLLKRLMEKRKRPTPVV